MSDYSQNNKERLQKQIINKVVRKKRENIMKTIMKDCKIKYKINIENDLMRENI